MSRAAASDRSSSGYFPAAARIAVASCFVMKMLGCVCASTIAGVTLRLPSSTSAVKYVRMVIGLKAGERELSSRIRIAQGAAGLLDHLAWKSCKGRRVLWPAIDRRRSAQVDDQRLDLHLADLPAGPR